MEPSSFAQGVLNSKKYFLFYTSFLNLNPTFALDFRTFNETLMSALLKKFFVAILILSAPSFIKANEAETEIKTDSTNVETAVASEEAHHEAAEGKEAEFNPTELINEHVGDSHQWHLWGDHGHSMHIPLPVILYTDKGLEIFSSSNLEHHEDRYEGNYTYSLHHEHIEVVNEDGSINEEATSKIIDISITKNVAQMLISVIVLLLVFSKVAKAYQTTGVKTAPTGLQSFLEPMILFVRDEVAIPNIGEKKHERFMPLLLSIFFFILINNLFGMLPIGANLTGNIAFTMVMGIIVLVVTNINGTKAYWSHVLMPPVPKALWPIMIPVEIIGVFSKPFALVIRLFANITAGHIIIISLISLIFIAKSVAASAIAVPFALFIDVLELLVAFLQAFIFTMLTALFIGGAMDEGHHDEAHADGHH